MNDNLIMAINYLPKEFITMELVMAAAKEHHPELLDKLPKEFLTEDVINEVFSGKEYKFYWSCDLSRVPEQYRTQDICRKALMCSMSNLPYVPPQFINSEIAEKIVSSSGLLYILKYIPQSLWSEALIFKVFDREDISQNSYRDQRKREKALFLLQIILSHVPQTLKTRAFYLRLFEKKYIPQAIDLLTPKKFKDREYYGMMARIDLGFVPVSKLSYRIMLGVLSEGSRVYVRDMFNNAPVKEYLMSVMDDVLADAVVTRDPEHFHSLPQKYQTQQRLILAVKTVAKKGDRSYYKSNYTENLLTMAVVKEFVRHGIDVQIPKKFWAEKFVRFCFENGQKSFFWFKQMPQKFQSRQIVTAAVKYSHYNLEHCLKKHISKEITAEIMREVVRERGGCYRNYVKCLPASHFTEFKKKTGLSEKFLGGEQVDFIELKDKRKPFTYCRLGNLFAGVYVDTSNYDNTLYLIVSRVEKGKEPEVLFDKYISTFHKTWLEKAIAEHDPHFVKPVVDPSLRDVQGLSYYGVEFVENTDGYDVYKNTFCGIVVGYCVKKDGLTYHADTINHAMNGWEVKVESEKTADAPDAQASAKIFDDCFLTATMLHKRYNFCELGMTAFTEDYGLDYNGRYKVSELRQIVALQGPKPSVVNYRRELRRINVIQ